MDNMDKQKNKQNQSDSDSSDWTTNDENTDCQQNCQQSGKNTEQNQSSPPVRDNSLMGRFKGFMSVINMIFQFITSYMKNMGSGDIMKNVQGMCSGNNALGGFFSGMNIFGGKSDKNCDKKCDDTKNNGSGSSGGSNGGGWKQYCIYLSFVPLIFEMYYMAYYCFFFVRMWIIYNFLTCVLNISANLNDKNTGVVTRANVVIMGKISIGFGLLMMALHLQGMGIFSVLLIMYLLIRTFKRVVRDNC